MTAIYGNMMEGTRQTSNESTGQIQSKTIECVAFFFMRKEPKEMILFSTINVDMLCSKMFGKLW